MKLRGVLWIVVFAVLAMISASGFSFLAQGVPWILEVKAASVVGTPNLSLCQPSMKATAAQKKWLQRIYPQSPGDEKFSIEVQFIHDDRVNAFASLGGKIFVTSKLLFVAESPEELAGVVAHEIGHVQNRHVIQGIFSTLLVNTAFYWAGIESNMGQIFRQVMGLKFSRHQEEEADSAGVQRLLKANVDIKGLQNFFNKLENLDSSWEIMSDHPASRERALALEKYLPQAGSTAILTAAEWTELKSICK